MILPLTQDRCLCVPFADYVNITVANDDADALLAGLIPILDIYGCLQLSEGLFSMGKDSGTMKLRKRQAITTFSTSGQFLKNLRDNGFLDSYLTVYGDFSHNVSMLHATCDYKVDAPAALQEIYSLATSGNFYLSRKAMNPNHVTKFMGLNTDGVETGTVNLGYKQNYDIWAKAYDKRHERVSKGFDDCGEMLRIEIAIQTDVGATLRDVSNPHDIFYQYASKSLVTPPKGFSGWQSYAGGLSIDRKDDNLTTWQRIKGIIEHSNDFKRVLDLAISDYGSDAAKEIDSIIRQRISLLERAKALEALQG